MLTFGLFLIALLSYMNKK
nr:putative holin-like toxin [Clostridium sp. MD294]